MPWSTDQAHHLRDGTKAASLSAPFGLQLGLFVALVLTVHFVFYHQAALFPSTAIRRLVLENAAVRLAILAGTIGGPKRAGRTEEFITDIIREDAGVSSSRRLRHAVGLTYAACVMRAGDLARPLLRPVDWALARPRTEAVAAGAAIAAAVYFLHTGGLPSFMDNIHNIVDAAGGILAPGLRRYRSIPSARRHDRNHRHDRTSR